MRASLDVFEEMEAVTKIIIKGQRYNMRDVSGTHRVDLDWLLIASKIAIHVKYVNSARQIAYVNQGFVFAGALDAMDTLVGINETSNALLHPFSGICILSRQKHVEVIRRDPR